jgi:hypothetical protein
MKQLLSQLACMFVLAVTAQAQSLKGAHSLNVQYGLTYASDLSNEKLMNTGMKGFGYQYTSKKNWYVGTDVQFYRSSLSNSGRRGFGMSDDDIVYACNYSGTGFFVAPETVMRNLSVITNDKVYRSSNKQAVALQRPLEASRLNVMLHAGRRWQMGKSRLEAGLTFAGSFISQETEKTRTRQQAIGCSNNNTGQQQDIMFNVVNLDVVKNTHSLISGGVHARYQYNLNRRFGIGVQVMTFMNTEGLALQAAPRMVMNF